MKTLSYKLLRLLLSSALVFIPLIISGQTTIRPYVASQDNNWVIESIAIESNRTIVKMHIPPQSSDISVRSETILSWDDVFSIEEANLYSIDSWDGSWSYRGQKVSSEGVSDLMAFFDQSGLLVRNMDNLDFDKWRYGPRTNKEQRAWRRGTYRTPSLDITLYFDAIPKGVENIYIKIFRPIGQKHYGTEWKGIKIDNPWPESMTVDASEIYKLVDAQNDGIVGIYEGTNPQGNVYTLACIKDDNRYKIVFMDSKTPEQYWHRGEIKCDLYPSATPGLFKGDWYLRNKLVARNCFVTFDGSFMSAIVNGNEERYVKMYPIASPSPSSSQWSGSGFAIKNNYIVTNHHVIDGAKDIKVIGINGNHEKEYSATVAAVDKNNDLAIIRLDDGIITDIPYAIDFNMANVGQDIFVLGYPLISTMGEEIKYTSGAISSRSGFEGDLSTYQISAPIQPGNSGGPLFDSKGNIVGIVNAKHTGADNAGYAIKTSFLKALIENADLGDVIPNGNTSSEEERAKQIETVRDFVYLIKCSGTQ